MSLLHRIPPMISALAFGYGVGMAAPESAVETLQNSLSRSSGRPRTPPPARVFAAAAAPPPPDTASTRESGELARLRQLRDADADVGASCSAERPTLSRSRSASVRDRVSTDPEDLDPVATAALSKLQLPDVHFSVSRRTLKFVRYFTRNERGRALFESWLKRSGRYQDLVQDELRERGLPEDLIWVAMIESGFDPRAQSPAGAVGLWQFMPSTGAVYGLMRDQYTDQRMNPRLATRAAAHHLRDLYQRFGDWSLALAAYNMGYEQLLDAIDRYGTSDFGELARQEAIPAETASYVPKIAAAAIVANNLERFGFDRVAVQRPIDSAEIAVPPGTPLKTLAKAAGVSMSTVRALNPDMLDARVPPGRSDYMLLVPSDALARAQAALPSMVDAAKSTIDDVDALDPMNLMSSRRPRTRGEDGSLLSLLPHPKHRHALRDADLDEDTDADEDDLRFDGRHARRKGRETVLYKASEGDTVVSVARQFAVDAEDVARENHVAFDAKLKPGAMLKLKMRKDHVDASSDAVKGASPGASEPAAKPHASLLRLSPIERAMRAIRGDRGAVRTTKKDREQG